MKPTGFQFNSCDKYYLVEVPKTLSVAEKFAWCELQESDGKFYHWQDNFASQPNCCWWFEYDVDAMLFKLKFS